jgi:GT2 family glycosyltransferase
VIVFGSAVTSRDVYERCARKGFDFASERESVVIAQAAEGSIFHTYNRILEQAAALEGLDGLVLAHQDCEIVDPDFCAKLRRVFGDPEVGVIGCVGAIGVRSIAWWEGAVTWASFIHRYPELGGGEFPSLTWDPDDMPPYARKGEADTLDGLLMVVSPWVARNIRFDESLDLPLHGYDFDLCLQVREAGRKVMTEDLRVVHHHSLELVDDPEPYVEAHIKIAEKWTGRMPSVGGAGGDWKLRARRAEAEASATRTQARSWQLQIDARRERHERDLKEIAESTSLRLTAPLRRLRGRLSREGEAAKRYEQARTHIAPPTDRREEREQESAELPKGLQR